MKPALATSSRKSGEDLLVGLCGFATSLLTAVILWLVEVHLAFAFYTWILWFVIPVGAFLSGFAGATGYYAGSWFFGHRPTRLLLLNIVIASVTTFFLIHYLSYASLQVEEKYVSDYIPFTQYLDIAIRSTSMEFRQRTAKFGSTGELGGFGYLIALLQIGGFAAGGFAVYGYLVSKLYCETCSRYLSAKGKQLRYTGDVDGLKEVTAQIFYDLRNAAITSALDRQKAFGDPAWRPLYRLPPPDWQKSHHLRSIFEVRHCKGCGKHWVKFSVEKRSRHGWMEFSELTVASFTDQEINL